jgi:4-hydroxy-3-polyprenylbenzoate decarboxylase
MAREGTVRRIVVGISGSTGAIYGIRLLQILRDVPGVETHLIITAPGKRTLVQETEMSVREVEALAGVTYDNKDIGASLASGSFRTAGMVIAPCSIKTAAGLAYGFADTLLIRAGDVTLKEGRPLVLLVRETPLHVGHLRMLTHLAETGAVILPPMPAFYHRPKTLDDIINHTLGRTLDRLGIEQHLVPEWRGTQTPRGGNA